MIAAVASMTSLGLGLGLALGIAARRFHVETPPIVDEIEAVLPGTNCGACGFPGCRGLAEAMAEGAAPVGACPAAGREEVVQLVAIVDPGGLSGGGVADPATGGLTEDQTQVAFIFEDHCTGCGKCFKRCPTDAIVGAAKQIHTVVMDACIGCNACVEVCPTEAIVLRSKPRTLSNWYWEKPQASFGPAATAPAQAGGAA